MNAREMPHDLDAEAGTLGSIILDPEQLTIINLNANDFYSETNRTIYRAMRTLANHDDPIDITLLSSELARMNEFDNIGGIAYLIGLADIAGIATYASHYAANVAKCAARRRIINATKKAMQAAYDGEDDTDTVIAATEAELLTISTGRTMESTQRVTEPLMRVFHDLSTPRPLIPNITWGIPTLDDLTNGFSPGDLTLIAARPAMGKTALALQIAAFNANRGRHVLAFSLEMSSDQLAARLLSSDAKVDLQRLRTRNLTDRDFGRLADSMGRLTEYALWIDDDGSITLPELKRRARLIHARHGLDVILVDYLQLLTDASTAKQGRVIEVTGISRGLKQLARELDVPIIALSQLSRNVESRPGKRPMLSDLRDSGSLEQDSDVVAFIFREEYYGQTADNAGKAEVIIAKQRNGPTRTADLTWLDAATRFEASSNAYSDADISADMLARTP